MILALDYGEKRIGVAVTDETEKFTTALDYIPNKSEVKKIFAKDFPPNTDVKIINQARKDAKSEAKIELRKVFNKLLHLVNYYYPEKIVVGLPKVIDKDTNEYVEGAQAKVVRQFMKKFCAFLSARKIICEVIFVEESLTSQIAEENLKDAGVTPTKISEKIDSESARVMLEEYLAGRRNND